MSTQTIRKRQPAEGLSGPFTQGIRVFVYGTLKRDHPNHYLLKDGGAQFLGRCFIEGEFRMFNMGAFPCVARIPNKSAMIFGEVYRIDQSTLDALDILEGNGKFFTRSKVITPWKNTWMYFLPENTTTRLKAVIDGMWNPKPAERDFWYG